MKPKEYKLDIFECLSQISKKNIHFYDNLTDEQKKGFLSLIISRWIYGSPHELQILLLNHAINPYIFALNKHPRLIYKLFTTTSVRPNTVYRWKSKHQDIKYPLSINIISKYYGISKRESILHLPNYTAADILNMSNDIGLQPDELKNLKLELKKM